MTYPEIVQYLESFINYEKIPSYPYKQSLKLERIKDFLTIINNPQDSLNAIHVAGTKGKGSACAFISYILREAGFKVGLYTSPHLSDFRERIRILSPKPKASACPAGRQSLCLSGRQAKPVFEGMISEAELSQLVKKLKPAIDDYNKKSKYGPLSFFEVYTALAFIYFEQQKVDFAVLETGLGGRLDATNVVNPLVCAITPISYEHTQKLGNTLKEIAAEKAGIIIRHQVTLPCRQAGKSPSHQLIVVTAQQEKEAMDVIKDRCKAVGAKLYVVGKGITFKETKAGFNIKSIRSEYPKLKINLLGTHQIINASVAVGVIEALSVNNINIGKDAISTGLYNTLWPGRCEIASRRPFIVLDGAQNVASGETLNQTIKQSFVYKKLFLILGISRDKDIKGVCQALESLADEVILTKANNPRALEPEILAQNFIKNKQITNNVKQALDLAKANASADDLILVTGSLFVVGEARELILNNKDVIYQKSSKVV
jgi:dihydrofolate synthase/folylpolyglutamate synthase